MIFVVSVMLVGFLTGGGGFFYSPGWLRKGIRGVLKGFDIWRVRCGLVFFMYLPPRSGGVASLARDSGGGGRYVLWGLDLF